MGENSEQNEIRLTIRPVAEQADYWNKKWMECFIELKDAKKQVEELKAEIERHKVTIKRLDETWHKDMLWMKKYERALVEISDSGCGCAIGNLPCTKHGVHFKPNCHVGIAMNALSASGGDSRGGEG